MSDERPSDEELQTTAYGRKVASGFAPSGGRSGCRCRRSKRASQQEFKASVLGAYERGERAISVPRLQRLARFYHVPVDQLLPRTRAPASATSRTTSPIGAASGPQASRSTWRSSSA